MPERLSRNKVSAARRARSASPRRIDFFSNELATQGSIGKRSWNVCRSRQISNRDRDGFAVEEVGHGVLHGEFDLRKTIAKCRLSTRNYSLFCDMKRRNFAQMRPCSRRCPDPIFVRDILESCLERGIATNGYRPAMGEKALVRGPTLPSL